jgi:hypothetical protein
MECTCRWLRESAAATGKRISALGTGISGAVILAVLLVGLGSAPAYAQTYSCADDVQGANDQPGQKDLTRMCVAAKTGPSDPFELYTTWNWDITSLSGGNTADACSLYDTDGDGLVNLAVCITLRDHGLPANLGAVRLFTCNNKRSDQCTGSVLVPGNTCSGGTNAGASCASQSDCLGVSDGICMPAGTTTCSAVVTNTDPFPAGDSSPNDAVATCSVDLTDFGAAGSTATLIDVCSYPSQIPNSDPSDCVLRGVSSQCNTNADCNDNNVCTHDTCAFDSTTNKSFCSYIPSGSGTTCNGTADTCEIQDTCDNLSGFCDDKGFKPSTTECRASAGVCDAAENCTGTSAACPADGKIGAGTECRASAGTCDVAEVCDGLSNNCPANGVASSATSCTGVSNGGACDGADHCSGTSNTCVDVFLSGATVCRASAGQCDVAESCTGSSGACPADAFASSSAACTGTSNGGACDAADSCSGSSNTCLDGFQPSTTVCRASAGQCDVAESCTGSSGACPADAFASSSATCTGSSNGGACDASDYCSGSANTCIDGFQPSTFTCRASAGQCDVAESCTGSSGACPADAFASSSTTCTGSSNGGACDATDNCSGSANTCIDGFQPSTTVCRASAGQCDVAESCTGFSGACPADAFASSSTTCTGTSQGGACDTQDYCLGTSNTCVDKYEPSTTVCRASAGQCDVAESCTGSSGACPADAFASSSTTCTGTSQGGACDTQDYCLGTANTCVDKYSPSTTVCRASAGQCDVAESCTGSSGACPAEGFAASTVRCTGTSNGGACDAYDYCSGTANTCVDKFKPSTFTCRASAGQCDVAESCTGTTSACPADGFASSSATCTGTSQGGACDTQDYCSGTANTCIDKYAPSTTVCRASAGQCDVAESCTGLSGACPADGFASSSTTCTGTSQSGACDTQDYCLGTASTCVDKYQPSTTVCRASTGQCDVAESCTGSSGACPTDAFKSSTASCTGTSNGGVCDGADHCLGGADTCVDVFKPSTTVCRGTNGNVCDVAENCTGSSGACPTDTFAPTTQTCGDGVTDVNACSDRDTCDGSGTCLPNNKACSYLTNSELCTFDYDSKLAGRQFNVIFTPDVQIWPGYKQNSTNPGQFYYNAIVIGPPGPGSVTMSVPWPFITQGANPVHVYDANAVTIDNNYCFRDKGQLPLNGLAYPATITYADWASGAAKGGSGGGGGTYSVQCGSPGAILANGLSYDCDVTVNFTIPTSGKAYVNIHLDYGTKGGGTDFNPKDAIADRYDVGTNTCVGDATYYDARQNDSNAVPAGLVALATCTNYPFSHTGSGTGSDSVQNVNSFKKITGVFGQAINSSDGGAWPNVQATLKDGTGKTVLATGVTDKDGFYALNYKHTGKATNFIVVLGNKQTVVTLKANGWAEVDYDPITGTWFADVSGTK